MTARKPRPIFARARENLLNGPVAQLVEHLTFNQVVTGSIPVGLTILSMSLQVANTAAASRESGGEKVETPPT